MANLESDIKRNSNGRHNIFAHRVLKNEKYYIENFTGRAFEFLLRHCLLNYDVDSTLYKRLGLFDSNFEIYGINQESSQIDLILHGKTDRIVRIIECKWSNRYEASWIEQLKGKRLEIEDNFTRMNVLATIGPVPKSFSRLAANNDVRLIQLDDLIAVT